jgi:hypothetical protein
MDSTEKSDEDDEIEDDESVVSALRLRMYLKDQEDDGNSTDAEIGKGQRF